MEVFLSDLHPGRRELSEGERGVDDVLGVLHRADAAFLVEGLEPRVAADAAHASRDVVDFLVDLAGGDLELGLAHGLLDQRPRDQGFEDFLTFSRDHFIRQALPGDDFTVDDRDRIAGVDGNSRGFELRKG